MAVLKVGAATEVELKEKKHRIEDALGRTRRRRGGHGRRWWLGPRPLFPALDKVEVLGDEAIGTNILRRALEEPLRQIAINAGKEGSVGSRRSASWSGHGYDAAKDEYTDMLASGVIDPAKTRSALENAASVAALLLTTETVITDLPEKEKAMPGMPPRRRMDFSPPRSAH